MKNFKNVYQMITVNKVKRQLTERKKIFVNNVCDKQLVAECTENN